MNFLGIDVGTTSLKAAAFDENLNQLSQATVDYQLETRDVYAEFPAGKYWDLTVEGIKKAINEINTNISIRPAHSKSTYKETGPSTFSIKRIP